MLPSVIFLCQNKFFSMLGIFSISCCAFISRSRQIQSPDLETPVHFNLKTTLKIIAFANIHEQFFCKEINILHIIHLSVSLKI